MPDATPPRSFAELAILLVEDDAFARRLTVSTLNRLGVRKVTTAEDGNAALSAIEMARDPFHLILSDWNMPNMTGLDLLQRVRAVTPAMPFLMLTGHSHIELVKAARDEGASGFIVKPFSLDQLKAKISAVTGVKA